MNGLLQLHNENIAHRDLKPSNIFKSEIGTYVVKGKSIKNKT
jgi:serine/threonine protein kinase